jgi:hypothetical protein
MADIPEFSFESIMESLKKMFSDSLPGFLKGLPGKLMSSITDNPIISFLTKLFNLEGTIDSAKNKLTETTEGLLATTAPDLTAATAGSISAVGSFFSTNKTALDVDNKILKVIEADSTKVAKAFFENGVPPLDADGRPTNAYKVALDYRTQLVEYLGGADNTSVGALDPKLANRDAVIERIATLVTGIPTDATIVTLAATPPTTGIAGMLTSAQITLNDKNLTKGSLKQSDITMRIDVSIAAPAANEIKNNTPNYQTADVKQPVAPTVQKQASPKINIWAPK